MQISQKNKNNKNTNTERINIIINMRTIIHRFPNINAPVHYHIGTNAQENSHLIEQSNFQDLWFHAEDQSSCHVVAIMPQIPTLTKKQYTTIIKMGATLCKHNTNKLKKEKNISISYTRIKDITLTNTPGMVYTENLKTVIV